MIRLAQTAMLFWSVSSWAHSTSNSYVRLSSDGESVVGRLELAVRDVHAQWPLDSNQDGQVTWGEIRAQEPSIRALIESSFSIEQDHVPCRLQLGNAALVRHAEQTYVTFPVMARCHAPVTEADVRFELFFSIDPLHRALLSVGGQSGSNWVAFTEAMRRHHVAFTAIGKAEQMGRAFWQGLHHISIGWDHLCFLAALLLPSVLRRQAGHWEPRLGFLSTVLDVTKVVTAFTVAHSITLGLAAWNLVTPRAEWVEVAIAVSVMFAALNNLMPAVPESRWSLAFSLGLLHGFGFVSAIRDLETEGTSLWLSVVGFNVGVEAGQLAIVAVLVPLAWVVRTRRWYANTLVPVCSAIIVGLALFWTTQRV